MRVSTETLMKYLDDDSLHKTSLFFFYHAHPPNGCIKGIDGHVWSHGQPSISRTTEFRYAQTRHQHGSLSPNALLHGWIRTSLRSTERQLSPTYCEWADATGTCISANDPLLMMCDDCRKWCYWSGLMVCTTIDVRSSQHDGSCWFP